MLDLVAERASLSRVMMGLAGIAMVASALGFGGNPSVTAWADEVDVADVAIAISPATMMVEVGAFDVLRQETAIARRLVAAFSARSRTVASNTYVDDLSGILDQLPDGQLRVDLVPGLGRALLAARTEFEARVDTIADWLAVARAVSPELANRPVRAPERFLRRSPGRVGAPLAVEASDLRVATALRSTFGAHDADPATS